MNINLSPNAFIEEFLYGSESQAAEFPKAEASEDVEPHTD